MTTLLLSLLVIVGCILLVAALAWALAPRQPDEMPTPGSDSPDQWR